MKQVTLLFLRRDHQILLALKKRGFGAQLWNGVGGKVDPGETVATAAVRECQEEIGVTPLNLQAAGYLQFFDPTDPSFEHRCHIFTTTDWQDDPQESEEMRPEWFDIDKIPYEQMWPADSLWIPHVIAGELFSGVIHLSTEGVAAHDIKIVPALAEENRNEPPKTE